MYDSGQLCIKYEPLYGVFFLLAVEIANQEMSFKFRFKLPKKNQMKLKCP